MNGRSVGKIIEDRRKELGYTIEECSKKTRISQKFLEGIEADNYDIFPGEVYYLGFLRTYAQLLSLDANKLIHAYNKQKKIEEPAPLEELTKPLKKEIKIPSINKNALPIILIAFTLFIVIVGIIFLVTYPKTEKAAIVKSEDKVINKTDENEYVLNQRRIVKTFLPQEVLIIPDGDYSYKINIEKLDKGKRQAEISFINFSKSFIIKEKDIIQIDFNENNNVDVQIIVNEIGENGLTFTIERLTSEKGNGVFTEKNVVFTEFNENLASSENTQNILGAQEISLVISASRNGYVRLESDTEGIIEKLLTPGESIKISGKQQVILQITNTKYMSVILNNNTLQLPNEFIVYCIIKFVYDQQTQKYNLVTEFKK